MYLCKQTISHQISLVRCSQIQNSPWGPKKHLSVIIGSGRRGKKAGGVGRCRRGSRAALQNKGWAAPQTGGLRGAGSGRMGEEKAAGTGSRRRCSSRIWIQRRALPPRRRAQARRRRRRQPGGEPFMLHGGVRRGGRRIA